MHIQNTSKYETIQNDKYEVDDWNVTCGESKPLNLQLNEKFTIFILYVLNSCTNALTL